MITTMTPRQIKIAALFLISAVTVSACDTLGSRADACPMPEGHNLDSAFAEVQDALSEKRQQCAPYFDAYFQHLLSVAEGDPKPENKRRFSEFLIWASAEGIISKRQAQNFYNRYFNVKFVSLRSDYNNCSHTCPIRATMMSDMAQELSDKEQGLLKVSADTQSFYRADQLMKEAELVLEATCTACRGRP